MTMVNGSAFELGSQREDAGVLPQRVDFLFDLVRPIGLVEHR
jgi:hypothetical protein